ncbi:MAG: bifunctional homocysteine S-methyltransferase/methylenetetrahydrofolate reductase [Candidatus Eremiobacteraeota bacterium]|nr:bifunctional homocysteine S-methyltransferase/methylenetetrahydrofolate reductase [Candidatus Eremiobacteraeota bacterium]
MHARADVAHTWSSRILVADGAMGTLLIARGANIASCVEVLNLESPGAVMAAHRDYLQAGAQIIESNTFAANRLKLGAHELRGRLAEINASGVALARAAANGKAFVGGSVGPLGALLWPFGIVTTDEARDVFAEHIAALAAERPDMLVLETFASVAEAMLALRAAKATAPAIPALVSLSVVEDGKTAGGDPLATAFAALVDGGADAIGVNCAVGPQVVYDALAPIAERIDAPLSVMPNAGYPHRLDDRTIYESSPTYFGAFAQRFAELGATIIGGCCGTTPDHIRAIADALPDRERRRAPHAARMQPATLLQAQATARTPRGERLHTTAFERKLGRQFAITVEISPPRGANAADAIAAAKALAAAGADAVNISDNPTARLRMSSTALAHLIMRETGLATVLHLTCRDRNLLALQSELLGAAALGVTAILPLTGDPSNVGDFPKATSVFDVTSLGLTKMVRDLNAGKDHAGSIIEPPTHFRIGVAVNPGTKSLAGELEKVEQKLDAGADFAVTQPVFDVLAIQPFLAWATQHSLPVLVGVLLLRSYRNAEFLHNEVPGMHVPDTVRARLQQAGDAASEGIAIARDVIIELSRTPGVAGAYLIPQDRYEAAATLIAAVAGSLSVA